MTEEGRDVNWFGPIFIFFFVFLFIYCTNVQSDGRWRLRKKERKKEKSTVASTCCGFFSCSETNSWHPAATKKEQLRNDPVTIWYQEWRSHIHEKMKSARTFYDYSFVRCKIKKAEHTHTHSLVVFLKIHTKKMSHGFEQTTGKLSVDPGDEEAGKTLPSHYTTLGNVER